MSRANPQHPGAKVSNLALTACFLLFIGLLAAVVVSARPALARSSSDFLIRYQLQPGISAGLDEGGVLHLQGGPSEGTFLTARIAGLMDSPRRSRRDREADRLAVLLDEGSPGGARGFSPDADDDGDGLVDEDRYDGRDNDGDGLVDEDYAAVSDNMTVHQLERGSRRVHQESYRWSLPGLRSTVFLRLETDVPEGAALELTGPAGRWLEAEISSLRHRATGKTRTARLQPYVMQVPGSDLGLDDPEARMWLAVLVLEKPAGWLAREDGSQGVLQLPLSGDPLVVALSVAPSWPQLARQLGVARAVYEGVTDPVSGRRARWIIPAACSLCRSATAPPARVRPLDGEGIVVSLLVEPGVATLVDCDLLSLDGQPLGSPDRLLWLPSEGRARTMDWREVTPRMLRSRGGFAGHPFLRLEDPGAGPAAHDAEGVLEFHFPGIPFDDALAGSTLSGFWIDGRPFRTEVQAPGKPAFELLPESSSSGEVAVSDPAETSRRIRQTAHPPSLDPALLEGWPNPFRDVIQVRFEVPETVGEAFVWVEQGDVPSNLDKDAAPPWQGSGAGCTVKIYNINGQELVTLFESTVVGGEFTVSWNGTDGFGRQVASGTYFCKLQIDEWSVTRRIVYLR